MTIRVFLLTGLNIVGIASYLGMDEISTVYGRPPRDTGWNAKLLVPPKYQVLTSHSVRNLFSDTPLPVDPPSTVEGDCWITPLPITGTFKPGPWIFSVAVTAYVAGGSIGRARTILWRSALATGVGATAVTGVQVHSIVGPLTVGKPAATTYQVTLPELTLSNEYLLLQMAWEVTTQGTEALGDVDLWTDLSGCMVTSDFPIYPLEGSFGVGVS